MRISSYTDIYTLDKYKERVASISESIIDLKAGQFVTASKKKIEDQIAVLKRKESFIFKKLGVNNIEELNSQLKEYREAVLNLSGPALNQSFIKILEKNNIEEYEAFNEAVMELIQEEVFNEGNFKEQTTYNIHQEVMEYLNSFNFSKKKTTVFSSTRGFTNEGIFPSSFTKEQTAQWKKILKKKLISKNPKVRDIAKRYDLTMTSKSNKLTATATWFGITNQLTQKEVAGNEPLIKKVNQQLTDLIISKVPKDKNLIKDIINHVLSENELAFFVGKNEKDITGILGEIQGLYYLSKFMGNNLNKAIQWRGGTYTGEGSKKPHQDILFEGLGIQVKNTTADAEQWMNPVNFANASLEEMMNKAQFSDEVRDLFENYFGTLNFNVPYHMGKNGALPGAGRTKKAKSFVNSREKLESFSKEVDILLSLSAAAFMYIDTSEQIEQEDKNVLFLLGGAFFQTASNILSQVLEQIEEVANSYHFKVSSSLTQGKNIIQAINNHKRGEDYTSEVLSNLKLNTSFKF